MGKGSKRLLDRDFGEETWPLFLIVEDRPHHFRHFHGNGSGGFRKIFRVNGQQRRSISLPEAVTRVLIGQASGAHVAETQRRPRSALIPITCSDQDGEFPVPLSLFYLFLPH